MGCFQFLAVTNNTAMLNERSQRHKNAHCLIPSYWLRQSTVLQRGVGRVCLGGEMRKASGCWLSSISWAWYWNQVCSLCNSVNSVTLSICTFPTLHLKPTSETQNLLGTKLSSTFFFRYPQNTKATLWTQASWSYSRQRPAPEAFVLGIYRLEFLLGCHVSWFSSRTSYVSLIHQLHTVLPEIFTSSSKFLLLVCPCLTISTRSWWNEW